MTDTPKRPPSSPLDGTDPKKTRDGESSPSGAQYDLSDATIARIVELTSARVRSDLALEMSKMRGEVVRLKSELEKKDKQIGDLREELSDMWVKWREVADRQDESEQYSRRNCILIHGIPESEGDAESTDNLVVKVGEAIGADVFTDHIDRSHRLGRKWTEGNGVKYDRPIICKMISHKTKLAMMTKKKKLKSVNTLELFGAEKIYINECLTKKRAMIAKEARHLKKSGEVAETWTRDGIVFVKTHSGLIKRIASFTNFDIRDYQ